MEHLPPVGWADVATRRDLDNLATAVRREIDHLESNLGNRLRAEWRQALNQQTIALFTGNAALVGVVLAAAKLL